MNAREHLSHWDEVRCGELFLCLGLLGKEAPDI
jgi:hypothetical protein